MVPLGAATWKRGQGKRPKLEVMLSKWDKWKSQPRSFWYVCQRKPVCVLTRTPGFDRDVYSSVTLSFVLSIAFWTVLHKAGTLVICLVTTAGSFIEGPLKSASFSYQEVNLIFSYLCNCPK